MRTWSSTRHELELDDASAAELESAPPTVRRNVEHLRDYALREPQGKPRAIRLRFLASPVAILGDGRVEAIELVRNELVDGRAVRDRRDARRSSAESSSGASAIAASRSPDVPFDESTGIVPNDRGRVLGPDGDPVPGLYCAGWIKRGPSGVIGTNKKDATETVELLLEDARGPASCPAPRARIARQLLAERGIPHVLTRGGRRSTRTSAAAASRSAARA